VIVAMALATGLGAGAAHADLLPPPPTTPTTVPTAEVPTAELSGVTVPGVTLPETTLPETTVPETTLQATTVPTVPGLPIPTTIPALPSVTIPPVPGAPVDLPSLLQLPAVGQGATSPRAGVPVSSPSSPLSPVPGPQDQGQVATRGTAGGPGATPGSSDPGVARTVKEPAPRSVVDVAREFAFPFVLAGLVILFLLFESRLTGRDPKLTDGPVLADDEQLRFA
jgi:hypothetical protein